METASKVLMEKCYLLWLSNSLLYRHNIDMNWQNGFLDALVNDIQDYFDEFVEINLFIGAEGDPLVNIRAEGKVVFALSDNVMFDAALIFIKNL